MTSLRLRSPAKINWTLEVLRVRPDGYHELRSILQTITLCDTLTVTEAPGLEVEMTGDAGSLADGDPADNLAWRAASMLRERVPHRPGARIEIEKRIAIAAGLGGGSSNAAAVLRALNELWQAGESEVNLAEMASEIGSDPPFFVHGGTAAVSGRGERVELLADAVPARLLVAAPLAGERMHKTASMFAALTPDHYSEGDVTLGVREIVSAGRSIDDEEMANVFERVTSSMQPHTEKAMDALRAQDLAPHLAGAGPSFFLLLAASSNVDALTKRVRDLGFEPHLAETMSRPEALKLERV